MTTPPIPIMRRLPPEMKATVHSSIRHRHPEISSCIENVLFRMITGEDNEPHAMGHCLMMFDAVCHAEFGDLKKDLYILAEVFSDLAGEADRDIRARIEIPNAVRDGIRIISVGQATNKAARRTSSELFSDTENLVLLSDGEVAPISTLCVGDKIACFSLCYKDGRGFLEIRKVVQALRNEDEEVWTINRRLTLSPSRFVPNQKGYFRPVHKLVVGEDSLVTHDGTAELVESVVVQETHAPTFLIGVGESADGYVANGYRVRS